MENEDDQNNLEENCGRGTTRNAPQDQLGSCCQAGCRPTEVSALCVSRHEEDKVSKIL